MSYDRGEDGQGENRPRLPASRVRRRTDEVEPNRALEPDEVLEPGQPLGPGREPEPGIPPRGSLFAPRSFAGGRVQVFGCSPGFLLISLLVSLFLTILLNALF